MAICDRERQAIIDRKQPRKRGCIPHNRFESRARWRVRRDRDGRRFYQRPDGTLVLPVGAPEPDLPDDDLVRTIKARTAALRPAS